MDRLQQMGAVMRVQTADKNSNSYDSNPSCEIFVWNKSIIKVF